MIILSDGVVLANSVIMSSASDYFSTMLNNDKFVEGETKEVPMEDYGTKEAMEQVVNYIYSGDMNMEEIGFETLLEIMNIAKMLLLKTDSLCTSLEAYIISLISEGNPGLRRSLQGFMLVERYRLDSLRKHIVNYLNAAMVHLNVNGRSAATLQQINVKMMKEIMLYKEDPTDPTVRKWKAPSSKAKLHWFQAWYSKNKDCKAEERKIILDSIDFDGFTGEELLTVVKKSGLFSEEIIDKKCIEMFRKSNQK